MVEDKNYVPEEVMQCFGIVLLLLLLICFLVVEDWKLPAYPTIQLGQVNSGVVIWKTARSTLKLTTILLCSYKEKYNNMNEK